ncbi:MAG: serine/threonine protein kinase [Myxococcales bacterium]|nr:serine/threonine protein kinase [Myxococcales bacterium]
MSHLDRERAAAFAQGKLEPVEAERVERHARECAACDALIADLDGGSRTAPTVIERPASPEAGVGLGNAHSPRPPVAAGRGEVGPGPEGRPGVGGRLPRGASVGRYVILGELGEGGMGTVYAAYDPELDRRVALKLLTPELAGKARSSLRLLREAQAMARLAHPNVIAVHDVGELGQQVFVAMELVEGPTLRAWVKERPRRPAEIVSAFASVGLGLAAAHDAGLVHRDFKPDNVLIGRDGRARVTDFGLARADASSSSTEEDEEALGHSGGSALSVDLTAVGTVLGTPGYMSPEQHLGRPTTARTDQFSFSVALYEALYQSRPFFPGAWPEFARQVRRAEAEERARRTRPLELPAGGSPSPAPPVVREPPRTPRVPARIRRALTRGLAFDPERRHESMRAFLRELRWDPQAPRRRAIGVGLLATVGTIVAMWKTGADRQALCAGSELKLSGAWDAAIKERSRAAFQATGRPHAIAAFAGVERALDAYAAKWAEAHSDACRATRVRGEQSDEMLTLRMACLDRRLEELRALCALFASADEAVANKAVMAAESLSSPADCSAQAVLSSKVAAPAPAARAQVEHLQERLAQVRAMHQAGRYSQGAEAARALLAEARALGYRPLEAEALEQAALLEQAVGSVETCEKNRYESVFAALASGDERLAARVSTALVYTLAVQRARYDEARRWLSQAQALLDHQGERGELRAYWLSNAGILAGAEGDRARAVEHAQQALELREEVLGPESLKVAETLLNLSSFLHSLQRLDEAAKAAERALAIYEKALGTGHPDVGSALINLGVIRQGQGRLAEAEARLGRALDIREATVGRDHPSTLRLLATIGMLHADSGDHERAVGMLGRALEGYERTVGPESIEAATTRYDLGSLLATEGKFAQALPYYQRALEIREKALGPEHPEVAAALEAKAEALLELGRASDAVALYERALGIRERALEPDNPELGYSLLGLGQAQLAVGRARAAVPRLERALKLWETGRPPGELASARLALAQALWDSGGDRARARGLAVAARDGYASAGGAYREKLSRATVWLASRR